MTDSAENYTQNHTDSRGNQDHGIVVSNDFRQFIEDQVVLSNTGAPVDGNTVSNDSPSTSAASNSTLWCSLYETLYHDGFIPHTTGLKPGTQLNRARLDRVAKCSKDFLDNNYPLKEGSHHEAVSYMVYFQNLLVILADGSTTGLQHPKQFVGKNGPTNEPESIMLDHDGMLIEIQFNANGKYGEHDLANIEDVSCKTPQ